MSRVSRRDAKGMAVLRWVEVTYSSYCIQGQRSAAVAFWLEHVVEPCRQRRKGRSGRGHGAGIDGSVPRV